MKKVLVVDDSGTARMFTGRCLEISCPETIEVLEAEDGKEGLDLLKLNVDSIDLVITDLNMPVMDGKEFVRRISASPKLHGTPVIVVTSSANPEINKELMDLGTTCIVEKPLTPAKMVDAISKVEDFKQDTSW